MQTNDLTQGNGRAPALAEQSIGELARDLSDESSRLARLEIELAKAELAQKGRQVGLGAGALGAAGIFGIMALGALTATAILGLAELVDAWLAALIVTTVLVALAGVLALIGKDRMNAGTPPVPERALASTKQDIEAAKRSAKEARG